MGIISAILRLEPPDGPEVGEQVNISRGGSKRLRDASIRPFINLGPGFSLVIRYVDESVVLRTPELASEVCPRDLYSIGRFILHATVSDPEVVTLEYLHDIIVLKITENCRSRGSTIEQSVVPVPIPDDHLVWSLRDKAPDIEMYLAHATSFLSQVG